MEECPSCGSAVPEDASYCSDCGTGLGGESSSPSTYETIGKLEVYSFIVVLLIGGATFVYLDIFQDSPPQRGVSVLGGGSLEVVAFGAEGEGYMLRLRNNFGPSVNVTEVTLVDRSNQEMVRGSYSRTLSEGAEEEFVIDGIAETRGNRKYALSIVYRNAFSRPTGKRTATGTLIDAIRITDADS